MTEITEMAVATSLPAKESPAMNQARPMMGNEAIARGVWEAGTKVASAYPGTPSTEILESLATYPAEDIEAQWATNEKVAYDVATGAALSGVRAFAAMKHVGLNVAADSMMSQTYIGVNSGFVIAVCDDPGIHSSQNEQDTRLLAQLAMAPVLEPADAQEALDYTRIAFDISEQFDTPVILRSNTRLSHTRSLVKCGERLQQEPREFLNDPKKGVMIPLHARMRHPLLLEREQALTEYFNQSDLTRLEKGSRRIGVITVGISYSYVKEVLPSASVLKLASSYPLAEEKVREFCESVDRVIVVEELEPVVENAVRLLGFEVEGKSYFPRVGEFSPELVRECFEKAGVLEPTPKQPVMEIPPMPRPPLLCSGCPHSSSYMALRAVNARVAGDIGCYTLSVMEPLHALDTTVAMGSSIGNAVGMAKGGNETRPIIATIGDSTFLHAGIPPLIDAVYNQANITVMLLDNHTTAMTGGQDHAGTGVTLRGEKVDRVDFEKLVRSIGVKWVRKTDSYNLGQVYQVLREAIKFKGVSVIISDRPCVLDPQKIKGTPYQAVLETCTACQSCMNLGCPAINWSSEMYDGHHKVTIDPAQCIGCSLCAQVCSEDAIRLVSN